jgi:tRNA 2-selenouridine synthase
VATILSQIGWRTAVLVGGYKTYRRHVRARLYDGDLPLKLALLDGRTGSGKTEVLRRLRQRGVQVLDLEALAEHRGSVFGAVAHAQPTQKLFESRLLAALDALDLSRPVVVEAEASKVGDRMIAPVLWKAMAAAPRIVLAAPPAERARYLVAAYAGIAADRARLEAALAQLPGHPGRKALARWRALADDSAFEALAADLIEKHYDPAYDRASRRDARPQLGAVSLRDLAPASLEATADQVSEMLERLR